MENTFLESITLEIAKLLVPLKRLNNSTSIAGLIRDLGWKFEGLQIAVDLDELVGQTELMIITVDKLASAETDEETLELLQEIGEQILAIVERLRKKDIPRIEATIQALPGLVGESDDLAGKLVKRLFDWLVYIYLSVHQCRLFAVLHILGIAEISEDDYRRPIKTLHWDRICLLFSNPLAVAESVYRWNSKFAGDEFLARVELLMRAFLLPGGIYRQNDVIREAFGRPAGDNLEMRIPIYQTGRWSEGSYAEFDLNLSPIPAVPEESKKAGLGLYPYIFGQLDIEKDLGGGWQIQTKGNAKPETGLGIQVEFRPPHNLDIKTGLIAGNAPDSNNVQLEVGIQKVKTGDTFNYIFGAAKNSHLAYQKIGFHLLLSLSDGTKELAAELEIENLTLAITSDNADGFIRKILSGININASSDFVFGYSNLDGVYFRGSGALATEIPIHKTIGPIRIDSILIGIAIDQGFEILLAASFGAELGPVSANVQEIGLLIPITFPKERDGNLGPLQIRSPKFKPPKGAGLSVNAGGIVGAGFLEIDEANNRYAGILTLNFGEIGLTAIGLITTRMPDGSDGFAMLINIGVTFDPPIQLSFGFTLSGVGGLIAINRAMEIDVLRAGIKNRTLDSILFPEPDTIVANASKIISDMRAVFPPAEGRFVVGPMVKIGWGSPNIITATIGIFIELPDPVRIVLMGQLAVALPKEKNALVVIHLDILGVLDLEKEELTFQATLYDSRILTYDLSGDSAFLLSWGNDPRFALSLGGFHPKFTPPAPPIVFADLKRLTLSLSSGKNLQLSCRAYQALTPNSLQFGARVDLYVSKSGASITGHLGFDALIYFSPFFFEVDISAGVQIRYKGKSLAEIHLHMVLSGPTPWNARGKVKIKILFIKVKIKFNITWGHKKKTRIETIDPWNPLLKALSDKGNWGSVLPAGHTMVETLWPIEEEEPDYIIVHPAGRFEIRQNVAPLDMDLSKFGNAPISGHNRFDITDLKVNGESLELEPVDEFFARAQFEDLSDDQKLSVPSFEKMKGGVTTAASKAICIVGGVENETLAYESILIKPDRTSDPPRVGNLVWDNARTFAKTDMMRRAVERAGPKKRFSTLRVQPKVGVPREEQYCVVKAANLTRASLNGRANHNLTRMAADRLLQTQLDSNPEQAGELIVVPECEVEEVMV